MPGETSGRGRMTRCVSSISNPSVVIRSTTGWLVSGCAEERGGQASEGEQEERGRMG